MSVCPGLSQLSILFIQVFAHYSNRRISELNKSGILFDIAHISFPVSRISSSDSYASQKR